MWLRFKARICAEGTFLIRRAATGFKGYSRALYQDATRGVIACSLPASSHFAFESSATTGVYHAGPSASAGFLENMTNFLLDTGKESGKGM